MCAWSYTLDVTVPAGSDPPSSLDNVIRDLKSAIAERLAIDHSFDLTGGVQISTDAGKHIKVTLMETTKPTAPANTIIIYAKEEVGGATELYWVDPLGNEKQISSAGKLNIAITDIADALITQAKIRLANNSYLLATDAAGTGTVNLIKANASDKSVLPDASQLATTAAPTLDADISNKKYVDDQVATRAYGALQTTDSDGASFAKDVVYLASCDGTVTWYDQIGTGNVIYGLVGTANPPTTVVAYFYNSSVNTRNDARSFEVAAGEYWDIESSAGVDNIYWRPRGTGTCSK